MENHSSVTGWQELFFSFFGCRCNHFFLRYTTDNLQVNQFLYALLARADKIFQKRTVFVFTESWSRDQLIQKAYLIQNRKHYACPIRSGPPVDRFHTKTGGRFAFTEYRCEVSFRGEILSPVQQPG